MNLDSLAMSELIKSKTEETSAPKRTISLVTFDTGEPITTAFQSAAFMIYIDGIAYLWNHKDLPQPMPQRELQGLTDEETRALRNTIDRRERGWPFEFIRVIEAKLKEKNNAL